MFVSYLRQHRRARAEHIQSPSMPKRAEQRTGEEEVPVCYEQASRWEGYEQRKASVNRAGAARLEQGTDAAG